MPLQFKSGLVVLALLTLAWTSAGLGQTPQQSQATGAEHQASQARTPEPIADSAVQALDPRSPGSISGTIVDQSGAVVPGAQVRLADEDQLNQEAPSGTDGQFFFPSVTPGPFHLTITSAGFTPQSFSGILHAGEIETVPEIILAVASNLTEVQVGVSQVDVAEEEIKVEEKQRILGAIPNFYVSYVPNAAPLTARQKFELASKSVVDPFSFAVVAGAAGVEQAQNHFRGYGQGAQGYAKRFGAGYADTVTGTFIGGAILPSLLKQDPRYFYKGTGSRGSRMLYALANAVICKGDNGRWQPNYSGVLGSLAAGGISNLYYPAQDRDGLGLTIDNTAIGIGETAITNLLQEFVIRKFTPKAPKNDPAKP